MGHQLCRLMISEIQDAEPEGGFRNEGLAGWRAAAFPPHTVPGMSSAPDPAVVRRVSVVHGYQAAPDRHWFPWLDKQLASDGFTFTVVPLPDSETPAVRAWRETLAAAVGKVDAQTWFVGHSLGCITVLRYLGGLIQHVDRGRWT